MADGGRRTVKIPETADFLNSHRPPSAVRWSPFPIYGEPTSDLLHLRSHFGDRGVAAVFIEHIGDPIRELDDLAFAKAARRHRRRADAKPARDERAPRIVRHGVLVHRDVRTPECSIRLFTGDVATDQIEKEQMIVSAARYDLVTAAHHLLRHRAR